MQKALFVKVDPGLVVEEAPNASRVSDQFNCGVCVCVIERWE